MATLNSVLGPLDTADLGFTLTHEHVVTASAGILQTYPELYGDFNRLTEQALTRLAHCVLTANVGLPHHSIREAIALAIHLVVHLARTDNHRRVANVLDVRGHDARADRFDLGSWMPAERACEGAQV